VELAIFSQTGKRSTGSPPKTAKIRSREVIVSFAATCAMSRPPFAVFRADGSVCIGTTLVV